jgi:CheY-like chemotaxis protein
MAARKTILVVEDNEVVREGTASLLRAEGYAAATAGHGREALDYLRANPPPDLILLDLTMPVLDGWRFLEELRNEPGASHVPVVVATAAVKREGALAKGCAGYLHKPFEIASLLAEVRRCLG